MPEMNENTIFEAFGLEKPAEQESGEALPVADEASRFRGSAPIGAAESRGNRNGATVSGTETSDQSQTPENAAQEQGEDGAEAAQEGADGAERGENEQDTAEPAPQQSAQERREQAAARRRREQQEAVERAVADARAEEQRRHADELKDFFAAAGLRNTMTGEPITTMEEFRTWQRAYDAQKLEDDLNAGKLTQETLDRAISNNPIVRKAQEVIRASEEAKRQSELAAAQARAEAEIAEINRLDPEAKLERVEDLLKMDNAKEFYDFVKKGNSFVDAYKLANYDRLAARRAEAAKQQALSNARSKDHLTGAGVSRGSGSVSVPQDQMRLFRMMNPGASEDEIRRYYNKYQTERK